MSDLFRKSFEADSGPIDLTISPEQPCALGSVDVTIKPKPQAQEELSICLCRFDAEPQRIICECPADSPEQNSIYACSYVPPRIMRFRHGDYLTIQYDNSNDREWSVTVEFEDGDL